LQRWVQLLLYARPRADGLPNPLLPVAATRAAQMESLVKQRGGDRDAQDAAYTIGVFSLLDVLLRIPMAEIAAALKLAPDCAAALLERRGELGQLLALVEAPAPTADDLQAAGVAPPHWWQSQLHAYHWAIQVSRNL
jgi:EAL and modified HD-GYP domain-containing signal transduction protein